MGSKFAAIKKWVALAPKTLIAERLEICSTCPNNKLGVCMQCGCILKFKTKLASSKCPIHKW